MTGDDLTVLAFVIAAGVALMWTITLIAVAIVAVRIWHEERHAPDPPVNRSRHVDLDLGFDRLTLAPWPDELAQRRAKHERDGGRVA